jgi:alpha-beta hydrolase superfamily lysophospholipase
MPTHLKFGRAVNRLILILILVTMGIGCSEQRAEELFETARLEERQNNPEHAKKLYQKILDKYPQSSYAERAQTGLGNLPKATPENPTGASMTTTASANYSKLDRPQILAFLFHPRKSRGVSSPALNTQDIMIEVEDGVEIGARFHLADKAAANILFFHGNGEIVADYDDLGPLYTQLGLNFLAVDYRGYGRSAGTPTVSSMMNDCHVILDFVAQWLNTNAYRGPVIVMGRSLGSASALELAARHVSTIDGLVIESGFADGLALMRRLGIDTEKLDLKEADGFNNLEKIKQVNQPTLIIHAQNDHIIPLADGKALFSASPANFKTLHEVPGANHNTIFAYGLNEYLGAVKALATRVAGEKGGD